METSLGVRGDVGNSDGNSNGNGRVDAQIEAIQKALEKLEEIRKQQNEFVETSKKWAEEESPLKNFIVMIDKLRLDGGAEAYRDVFTAVFGKPIHTLAVFWPSNQGPLERYGSRVRASSK